MTAMQRTGGGQRKPKLAFANNGGSRPDTGTTPAQQDLSSAPSAGCHFGTGSAGSWFSTGFEDQDETASTPPVHSKVVDAVGLA